jgi:hypothetical protein
MYWPLHDSTQVDGDTCTEIRMERIKGSLCCNSANEIRCSIAVEVKEQLHSALIRGLTAEFDFSYSRRSQFALVQSIYVAMSLIEGAR